MCFTYLKLSAVGISIEMFLHLSGISMILVKGFCLGEFSVYLGGGVFASGCELLIYWELRSVHIVW